MTEMPNSSEPARGATWNGLSSVAGPLLALVVVIVFFGVAVWLKTERNLFFQPRTAQTVAVQASTVAVAALGMTVIIIAGGIDLSAGTALALASTVLAVRLKAGAPVAEALAEGLLSGAAMGLLNGALISTVRVVPFIVTLGTMSVFLGMSKIISGSTTVRPLPDQVPDWMQTLLRPQPEAAWMLVAPGVWGLLAMALLLAGVLRYTVFGRYVFALGSNESTARLCGINVPVVKTAVYVLAGLFVGVAGIYQFSLLQAGEPTSGTGMELKIITAVVIGGGSLSGGRGSVLGTLAGALMTEVISTGCTLLGLGNPIQNIVIGIILVAAAILDQWRQGKLSGA